LIEFREGVGEVAAAFGLRHAFLAFEEETELGDAVAGRVAVNEALDDIVANKLGELVDELGGAVGIGLEFLEDGAEELFAGFEVEEAVFGAEAGGNVAQGGEARLSAGQGALTPGGGAELDLVGIFFIYLKFS